MNSYMQLTLPESKKAVMYCVTVRGTVNLGPVSSFCQHQTLEPFLWAKYIETMSRQRPN